MPLAMIYVQPIGVMQMIDQREADDKIIAVHGHDPEFNHYKSKTELLRLRVTETRRFFEDYKIWKSKKIVTEDFFDVDIVEKIINQIVELYPTAV